MPGTNYHNPASPQTDGLAYRKGIRHPAIRHRTVIDNRVRAVEKRHGTGSLENMLKVLSAGLLIYGLASLHICEDHYERFPFCIDPLQVEPDFPYGSIPEPVEIHQMTATEESGNIDKLGPQRIVGIYSLVAADHFGEISCKVGCTRGNTHIEIKRIESRLKKAIQDPC